MENNRKGAFFPKKTIFTLLLMVFSGMLSAQTTSKYLVVFRDKASSPYAVSRPEAFLSNRSVERRLRQNISVTERDLPPNPAYVQAVAAKGARIWYKSRWANGVLVECTPQQLAAIETLPFVQGHDGNVPLATVPKGDILPLKSGSKSLKGGPGAAPARTQAPDYGYALNQVHMLQADTLHARGFRGEGMQIAVIDNGFVGVDKWEAFKLMRDENRVLGTYDFVQNNANVYDQGGHGTSVLSCMAAFLPGQMIGTAYKAAFLLLHTEDNTGEKRQEEAFWLAAAEYADSAGVDVINSSLGYTTFDNPATNYTYNDLNGDRGLSTRAADWAAQAGILVVIAAGNEGSDAWKYISVPADADSALSVGAVDTQGNYADFSSVGPRPDGRIKPDVAAQGSPAAVVSASNGQVTAGSGTSFATPILAGFATGVWQAFPYLTAQEVINLLKKSGSRAADPNNQVGYGVPTFGRVAGQMKLWQQQDFRLIPNPGGPGQNPIAELPFNTDNRSYQVQVLNLQGRVLWEGSISGRRAELPLAGLPQGLYVVQAGAQGSTHATRWLKW